MRLRELREERGLSQRTVAEYLGCSTVVYSRYETGAREPSIDVLIRIAEYYSTSVDYVIGRPIRDTSNTLQKKEERLLVAYRHADPVYQSIALEILESHPAEANISGLA